MAKKNKPQKLEEKIKSAKDLIVANSKDGARAKKLLASLTSLQKQANIEAVELVVPTKEVMDEIKEDAYSYKRTPRGILFQTKGGLNVFVENRLIRTYGMLQQLFDFKNDPSKDEETQQLAEAFNGAVTYIMQAPIFASLGENILFEIAAKIIEQFNQFTTEFVENAELKEETEQDIEKNNDFRAALEEIEKLEKQSE